MAEYRDRVKQVAASALCGLRVDRFLRHRNRQRLLVVMYHGVTRHEGSQIPWTQLPEGLFAGQVEFLARNYRLLHLSELVDCLLTGRELPERSALITFDDGLRNNLTVAYPILSRFRAPAAVFVATDFVGADRLYWFDELYLLLVVDSSREAVKRKLGEALDREFEKFSSEQTYWLAAEYLKRRPPAEVEAIMSLLTAAAALDYEEYREDYEILSWPEIGQLQGSGLVEFGVHTASHRILTGLEPTEWELEIRRPRQILSEALGTDVVAFAYPNGRPDDDYSPEHKDYLLRCGYLCAFTTRPELVRPDVGNALDIGRIPAGSDITSEAGVFRLLSSGFPGVLRDG